MAAGKQPVPVEGESFVVLWTFLGADGIGAHLSQVPSVGPGLQRDFACIRVQRHINNTAVNIQALTFAQVVHAFGPLLGFPRTSSFMVLESFALNSRSFAIQTL